MMIYVLNQDYFLYWSAHQQKYWTAPSQNSRSKIPRIYPIYQEVVVWMLESMRSCYFWRTIGLNLYDVDECIYQVILGCYEFLHITAGYHNGSLHSCLNLKNQNVKCKIFLWRKIKSISIAMPIMLLTCHIIIIMLACCVIRWTRIDGDFIIHIQLIYINATRYIFVIHCDNY